MRKIAVLAIFALLLGSTVSCQRSWERIRKKTQTSNRNYVIDQYSGGILVGHYEFSGILNDSEGSDGYYFYQDKVLIELSGDLVIKSTK